MPCCGGGGGCPRRHNTFSRTCGAKTPCCCIPFCPLSASGPDCCTSPCAVPTCCLAPPRLTVCPPNACGPCCQPLKPCPPRYPLNSCLPRLCCPRPCGTDPCISRTHKCYYPVPCCPPRNKKIPLIVSLPVGISKQCPLPLCYPKCSHPCPCR